MSNRKACRSALALAAVSLVLLLEACVCRPVRIGMTDYSTPSTLAELKASLP
jgi:hypothetical protein